MCGMMCKSVKESELDTFTNGDWVAERKFDGSRIVYKYGKFFTQDRFSFRDSRDVTYKFPDLTHTKINAVLDGEIFAESGKFEDTGSRIQLEDKLGIRISSKKNPVIYHIFDIMEITGESVEHLPLSQRKELLKSIKFDNPRFQLVEFTTDIHSAWNKVKEDKAEGIILKRLDGRYEWRRSNDWVKCKNWKEEEVLCESYEENPKGIRLTMSNGQGLQCAGGQSHAVKDLIDRNGSVRVEIQYLTKDEKAGGKEGEYVYRFPSFRQVVA